MQDVFARLVVVFAVALQNLMIAERVFERDERRIRLLFCTDEEDERFFADKTPVLVHSPDAVAQYFSFADEIGGGAGDDADKGAALVMFER